jgi:hypothetical protein
MEPVEVNPQVHPETPGVLEGGTAGVLEGELNNETAEVLEGKINGETGGVLEGETAGVSEGEPDSDGEITGVFPDNEQASTNDNQPSEAASEEPDGESDRDDNTEIEFHEEITDVDVYHPNTMMPLVQRTYGLGPIKPHDYSYGHTVVIHPAMTQYSVKSGLKMFKEKVENTILKELMQLHLRVTFSPQDATKLSASQKNGGARIANVSKGEVRRTYGGGVRRWAQTTRKCNGS